MRIRLLGGRISARRHKHREGWGVRIWLPRWFIDVSWYRHEPVRFPDAP